MFPEVGADGADLEECSGVFFFFLRTGINTFTEEPAALVREGLIRSGSEFLA